MAIITEYIVKEPDRRGIRHWVKFNYNQTLVDKVKKIPSSFRSFDPQTKMWGFNDRGWNLFCAISDVQFLGNLLESEETSYKPRKIDSTIDPKIDWEKYRVPARGLLPELYPWDFQKVSISQIIRNKNHGLFYEPGMGKTYTAVCAAKELLDRREVDQVVIVSLVGGILKQWAELLDRMGYSYTLIKDEKMVDRPQAFLEAKTDFIIILYTTLISKGKVSRSSKSKDLKEVFSKKAEKMKMMVIADEIHKLGDVSSKTFKALLSMSKKAKYKIALTGTIIKSTPEKALLPLRFIAPKVFSNKGVFEEAFMVKEMGTFGPKVMGYKNLKRLKELIHSYGSVVLKKDHSDSLPEILLRKKIMVETSKDSMAVLKTIRGNGTLDIVKNGGQPSYADLKDLYIRIHQAMICPSIFSDNLLAKNMLEAVVSLLEEVGGKTIIFTTLIGATREISGYLKKKKIKNVVCSGEFNDSVIDKRVEQFVNDPECKVMVATVQKMGTGRDNLKVAQNCIIYDFNMVAGDLKQAIDRLYRSGQKNKVSVFELVQDNPFSEYQREKVLLQENIIEQTEDVKIKAKDSFELTKLIKLAEESNLFGGKK